MKFINKFLKFCSLTVIRASLILGVILSDKAVASTSDIANGTFLSKSTKKIDPQFGMETLGVLQNSEGNYLRYKGRIYESGAQCINNVCEMVDVTSPQFDPTAEEYQLENQVTMLNIILGDELANDFIALSRWDSVMDLSRRKIITADTSHMSNKCLDTLQGENKEKIIDAINLYTRKYYHGLNQYKKFAQNLHAALSNDKAWSLDRKNPATHTEIMMICRILEQVGIKYDDDRYNDANVLKTTIGNKKDVIKTFLPKTIFSSKEMCRTCDTTLAGLYELLYGCDGSAETLVIGGAQPGYKHVGKEIDTLITCSPKVYNDTSHEEVELTSYTNRLSALFKRLVQIDNILTPSTAITEPQKKILLDNKSLIIQKCLETIYNIPVKKIKEDQKSHFTMVVQSILAYLESNLGALVPPEEAGTEEPQTEFKKQMQRIRNLTKNVRNSAQYIETLADKFACFFQSGAPNIDKNVSTPQLMLQDVQTELNNMIDILEGSYSLGPQKRIDGFETQISQISGCSKTETDLLKTQISKIRALKREFDEFEKQITDLKGQDKATDETRIILHKLDEKLKMILKEMKETAEEEWDVDVAEVLKKWATELEMRLNRIALPTTVLNGTIKYLKNLYHIKGPSGDTSPTKILEEITQLQCSCDNST